MKKAIFDKDGNFKSILSQLVVKNGQMTVTASIGSDETAVDIDETNEKKIKEKPDKVKLNKGKLKFSP